MAEVSSRHRILAHQVFMMGELHGQAELKAAIAQAIAEAEERGPQTGDRIDQITTLRLENPFIFTEEGKKQAFQAIDKAVKYGKLFFLIWVCGGLGLAGLILLVIVHFVRKDW